MAINSTKLSTIINRMDRYQSVATVEESFKVRDVDEAIRTLRRTVQPPWVVKQTTIAIFRDVYVYPVASDHQHLAMIEKKLNDGGLGTFKPDLKARYTSLEQFYRDEDSKNKIAEIWDGGELFLGIRHKTIDATSSLASGNDSDDYTATGDASEPTDETVETIDGLDTVKITITNSTDSATVTEAISPSISDTNYKKKYYFRWVYLDSVPTSITLRFGNDSSNYLASSALTIQFGGQALKADSWNLLAFNLNEATTTGTITDTAFDYAAVIFASAATGTYFIGPAYLRGYHKLDYYYYSFRNVKTSGSSVLDQNYFYNDTTGTYDTDDELVGDPEWIDVITFDAILTSLADNKNNDVIQLIAEKRRAAWEALEMRYPDMAQIIITQRWNFGHEPSFDNLNDI